MESGQHTVVNVSLRLPELAEAAGRIAELQKMQVLGGLRIHSLIEETFSARLAFEELTRSHLLELTEAGRGIEEFRRIAFSGGVELKNALEQTHSSARLALEGLNARFHLPEVTEAARLMAEFQKSPGAEALRKFGDPAFGLKHAIDSMRTPWLDIHEQMRSMAGFAGLQGIGHALGKLPGFDEGLASVLRIGLGDWRDRITWPAEIFTDAVARSDFYASLGFDRALTDFPAPAFQESLRISLLQRKPPALDRRYGAPVPLSEEEEDSFGRNTRAHDWLQRLETHLRRFIDEQMTRAFGGDWPRRRLPNGMYEAWQEKKRKGDQASGREWPLIAYADFTDYEAVICRRDNWREVFAPFFGQREENVRETFQRLYPVRLATAHSRSITQDDELFLYVEIKRLGKVIIVKRR